MRKPACLVDKEVKVAAVARMEKGESPSKIAREIGVVRQALYLWRAAAQGKKRGLRGPGRPPRKREDDLLADGPGAADAGVPEAIRTRRQIAELQRKIGEQEMLLEFFRVALRQFRGADQANDAPGAEKSTQPSKR
jgi:transposase-like protein